MEVVLDLSDDVEREVRRSVGDKWDFELYKSFVVVLEPRSRSRGEGFRRLAVVLLLAAEEGDNPACDRECAVDEGRSDFVEWDLYEGGFSPCVGDDDEVLGTGASRRLAGGTESGFPSARADFTLASLDATISPGTGGKAGEGTHQTTLMASPTPLNSPTSFSISINPCITAPTNKASRWCRAKRASR